jgi:AcrR family transcriptional regulator
MPRPSKPLIRREAVVEASLRIIDTEGLDAFSLPRLARELNVQAPSLYHHFEDKAEILKAVARAIVVETRLPDPKSVPNWIEWLVALSLAFRDSMLRHHNAVPLLLQFMPRDVLIRNYNESAVYLVEIGVALEEVVLILDGLATRGEVGHSPTPIQPPNLSWSRRWLPISDPLQGCSPNPSAVSCVVRRRMCRKRHRRRSIGVTSALQQRISRSQRPPRETELHSQLFRGQPQLHPADCVCCISSG